MRGFVTLGTMFQDLPNPRAWMFRVASNLWIDRMRRARLDPPADPEARQPDRRESREAVGALLVRLSPQERVAVLLKDVFDFSLDEVADLLATTSGAVKAALHRGRGKLAQPEDPPARAPAPGALDAFCEAFNARDSIGWRRCCWRAPPSRSWEWSPNTGPTRPRSAHRFVRRIAGSHHQRRAWRGRARAARGVPGRPPTLRGAGLPGRVGAAVLDGA